MVSGFGAGAAGAGLRASLIAAIAYDEVCSSCQIEVTFTAQAIILTGVVTPAAAQRAIEIVDDSRKRAIVGRHDLVPASTLRLRKNARQ